MKLTIFLLTLLSYNFATADIVIYGEDSRQEVEETNYSDIASYTVAMVNKNKINRRKKRNKNK